eukprot:gene4418-6245_t
MSFLLDEEKTWIQRDFGLDRRLIKALSKLGFIYPTLVQAKCIPIALQGKDILVRSRTGSGKTIAFALPILQKILSAKESISASNGNKTKCVILAPTKELIKQIDSHMKELAYYCADFISICTLIDDNQKVQQYHLQSGPDVLISTPARIIQQLKAGNIDISHVNTLVIDEADLVLSFGYADEVHAITSKMPKIFQGILVSATLSAELDKFKRLLLHNPAILRLEEPKGFNHLLQFYLETTEQDKFLILYVFIKLGLLQGKGLIFVNDVNKCYRLKLFLQQFFISAAVLNAEVPLNSRIHTLEEYNRGVFDYLIATDNSVDHGEDNNNSDEDEDENQSDEEETNKKKRKRKSSKKNNNDSSDYGVYRGIDFQGVAFVINFDFPLTPAAYTHRIGRTARGSATGTALSFVTKMDCTTHPLEANHSIRDHDILSVVRQQQPRLGIVEGDNVLAAIGGMDDNGMDKEESRMQPTPLQFNMNELESFRYRVEDTLRSVTAASVKELRTAEIKREILNSEKLKSFFAENPNDLKVLRHDKAILHPIRQKDHLKHVPDYLVPSSMKTVVNVNSSKKKRKGGAKTSGSRENRVNKSKLNDPLFASTLNVSSNENATETETRTQDRVFTHDDLPDAVSGRKQWKMNHHKGKFSKKTSKSAEMSVPGSFIKPNKKFK